MVSTVSISHLYIINTQFCPNFEGDESLWLDKDGYTLSDVEGKRIPGPPLGWNLVFHLKTRPKWPTFEVG